MQILYEAFLSVDTLPSMLTVMIRFKVINEQK